MEKLSEILVLASAGAGLFAVVGVLFGTLAGALARGNGARPGGVLGNAVARALGRRDEEDSAPLLTGAIVGAVDGGVFGAVLGFIVGAVVGASDQAGRFEVLRLPVIAAVALAIGALLLSGLAYVLVWGGARAIGLGFGALAGVAVGWLLEARWEVNHGTLYGALLGTLLGILAAISSGPHVPHEREVPTVDTGDGDSD